MSEHLRFWLPLVAAALLSIASVHAGEGRPDVVIAVNELPRGLEPADDVVFTFSPERLTGKDAVIPGGRQYFANLKQVEKIDPYTVRFVTEHPHLVFEQRLATYTAWIVNRRQWMQYQKADDKQWMQRALREARGR